MSEGSPETNSPSKKKGPTQVSNTAGCIIIFLILGFFAVFIFGASVFLEIPYQLIAGWVIFLIANVTALEMNWEMAACGLGALLIATYGLHRFFLWIRIGQPWKWSWTISLTTIMLMLFAASIAMTGIIHQLGWMVREPLTQSNRRAQLTHNVSNAKQIFYLVVDYDADHGDLPDNLQLLVTEGHVTGEVMKSLSFHPKRGGVSEPWIYLGAGKSLSYDSEEEEAGESPIIISPRSVNGKWVVLRLDGAVTSFPTQSLKKKYPWLSERLPNLFKGQ